MKMGGRAGLVLTSLLLVRGSATGQARSFEVRDRIVVAREGNRTLWENRHDRWKFWDPVGPVLAGDSLYYAVGSRSTRWTRPPAWCAGGSCCLHCAYSSRTRGAEGRGASYSNLLQEAGHSPSVMSTFSRFTV